MIFQKSNKKIPPQLLIETIRRPAGRGDSRPNTDSPGPARKLLLVNINSAPADSLELIPGIGPVIAERIVAYRDAHGRFQTVADLAKVTGIGPGILENIKEFLATE